MKDWHTLAQIEIERNKNEIIGHQCIAYETSRGIDCSEDSGVNSIHNEHRKYRIRPIVTHKCNSRPGSRAR